MFTGIVEETGSVVSIKSAANSIQLTVKLGRTGRGLKIGDSLAINGCCLTVVQVARRGARPLARFDLLQETWNSPNLQFARPGSLANLEPPLRAYARLNAPRV